MITMFFMITYAMINYSCFHLTISGSPGWRPGFVYYNAWTAITGCVICLGIMILIDPAFALMSGLVAGGIYYYVRYLKPSVNLGSALDARTHMKAMETVENLRRVK